MLRIKKSFIYHEVLHLLLHMQMIIGQIWSCWSNSSLTQSHTAAGHSRVSAFHPRTKGARADLRVSGLKGLRPGCLSCWQIRCKFLTCLLFVCVTLLACIRACGPTRAVMSP